MEFKVFILSLACLSCLAPAHSIHPLLALKGAALLKAGLIAKGVAVLGAKALIAKHLLGGGLLSSKSGLSDGPCPLLSRLTSHFMSKGASLLKAKHNAVLNAISAKRTLVDSFLPVQVVNKVEVLREEPIVVEKPVYIPYPTSYPVPTVVREPVIMDAVQHTKVLGRPPVVYEILKSHKFYPVPIVEKSVVVEDDCDK